MNSKYMLRVKTEIKLSDRHGLGLYAAQFIPKGTITWQFDPEFDIAFTEEQIARMPEHGKTLFMHYHYHDPDYGHVLCSDDQRFINHAANPKERNIQSTPQADVAIHDIQTGEELLCNYDDYDSGYWDRIGFDRNSLK